MFKINYPHQYYEITGECKLAISKLDTDGYRYNASARFTEDLSYA